MLDYNGKNRRTGLPELPELPESMSHKEAETLTSLSDKAYRRTEIAPLNWIQLSQSSYINFTPHEHIRCQDCDRLPTNDVKVTSSLDHFDKNFGVQEMPASS